MQLVEIMGHGGAGEQAGWRVTGASVQGAAHARAGIPNQDAILWSIGPEVGLPIIVAVSDGHGSPRSFRSETGARLAVQSAMTVLGELARAQPDPPNHTAIKRLAEERLPQSLVRAWQSAVEAHLSENPPTGEELARLADKDGLGPRGQVLAQQIDDSSPRVGDNLLLAYGATLLSVLVAPSFILYLQLGDGDILAVSETGEVLRPQVKDERLFGNVTTSLAGHDSWRDVHVDYQALAGSPPALILLSTDGYANSFSDEAGFLQVGADLLEMIRANGLDAVNESLCSWLEEASQAGSGDDITLGIVCRVDAVSGEQSRRLNAEAEP